MSFVGVLHEAQQFPHVADSQVVRGDAQIVLAELVVVAEQREQVALSERYSGGCQCSTPSVYEYVQPKRCRSRLPTEFLNTSRKRGSFSFCTR